MSKSQPLDLPEVNAMVDSFTGPRDRAAFLLSCGCGLRAGALCALKVSAVLDADHALTGNVAIPRRNMKGKKNAHAIAIPKRALSALAEWIAQHPAPHRAAPLFPSTTHPEDAITPRHWHRLFAGAARRAQIEKHVSPHSARKFFAHAIYEGTDKDIQLTTRALGNRSPMSTLHYLDFGQRRINAATLQIFNNATEPELTFDGPEQNASI